MLITYTAKYTKLENGYMGQLLEWPEVITEGETLEDCRLMLKDALQEMVAAYKELKMEKLGFRTQSQGKDCRRSGM
ncbi:MAG: type II toxin-antitoxin system HicB family antitoxin [Desulfotignum sp.]|nr:type II toxin-antitoxin system HicB family antitoxin [Desulfotignum sp.]